MKINIKNNLNILIYTSILILFGIILRTRILLANLEPYTDAINLGCNIFTGSYLDMLKPLQFLQVAPPLFMFFSKLMINIFHAENTIELKDLILRIIPYLSGILSLPLFSFLVHKMFNNKYFTIISSFIFIFNSYFIFYSLSFKQYSLEVLITLIITYIFYFIDFNNISLKKILCISLILSFLIWLSPISVIIIATGIILFFISMIKIKKFDIKRTCYLLLPLIANCLIFYIVYFRQVHNINYQLMESYWHYNFFQLNKFNNLFKTEILDLFQFYIIYNVYILYIFIFFNLYILIKKKDYKIFILCTLPILLYIIMCFLKIYPWALRLMLFLLPYFIIIICQFTRKIIENKFIIIFLEIIILIQSIINMTVPTIHYDFNSNRVRAMYLKLKELNPELKNIVGTFTFFYYYSGRDLFFNDNPYHSFNESRIPTLIKTTKEKDLWIYVPYGSEKNYSIDLLKYLKTNKNIKILDLYIHPEIKPEIFIAHIEII